MASRKTTRAQELARQRGFRTVYQMRQFEARNKAIGGAKAPTITRNLEQAKDTVRLNRVQRRDVLLARFGVTLTEYNKRDRENREWFDKELGRRNKPGMEHLQRAFLRSAAYHTYQPEVADAAPWTEAKVGYVLSFWSANVSRKTGYWSLYNDKLNTNRKRHFGQNDRAKAGDFNAMNASQYFYLTQFTDLMTVPEYEVSYGTAQTREAQAASLPGAVA